MSNETSPGLRGWWAAHGRAYLIVVAVTTVVVCSLAAALGVHRVLDAGLQAFGIAFALPFVAAFALIIVCAGLFLPLYLVALLLDSDMDVGGDFISGLVAGLIGGYFGWFSRRRHPVFWGVVSGALVALGGLALIS
jgi:hypothetical protein